MAKVTEKTTEENYGFYIKLPYVKSISNGKTKLFVKPKKYEFTKGKLYYLFDGSLCYGIAKITDVYPITLSEFEKLQEKHLITDIDKEKMWNGKKVLFAYEFDMVEEFHTPRTLQIPNGFTKGMSLKFLGCKKKPKKKPIANNEELDKKLEFTVRDHFMGKAAHVDLFFEVNDHLEGFTLNDLVEGSIKEPVLTVEEGKKVSADPKTSKIDWKTGSTKLLPVGERMKIVCQKKPPHPKSQLNFEGVFPKGEAGATKEFPGIAIIKDKGWYESGVQKPLYQEYFIHGNRLKGIYVFRKVPIDGFKPEKEVNKEAVWFFWKKKNQVPYLLTNRAVATKTIPPEGESWLPSEIEKRIPENMHWWGESLSREERLDRIRNAVKYWRSQRLEEDFLNNRLRFLSEVN